MSEEEGKIISLSDGAMVAFAFEGMGLKETCWIKGKPYFTERAVGEWLEYPHPVISIKKLVRRNPHIREFATITKVVIVEGGRRVSRTLQVYDPVGLQLIINKSNQPRALLFQVAVAHLVIAYIEGKLKPSKWSRRGDLLSAARQILSLPEGRKRRTLVKDLAERDGISMPTAYRRITLATGERLKTKKGIPRRTRSDAGSHRSPASIKKMEGK